MDAYASHLGLLVFSILKNLIIAIVDILIISLLYILLSMASISSIIVLCIFIKLFASNFSIAEVLLVLVSSI